MIDHEGLLYQNNIEVYCGKNMRRPTRKVLGHPIILILVRPTS